MLQEQDLGTPLTNEQSIPQSRLELARNYLQGIVYSVSSEPS